MKLSLLTFVVALFFISSCADSASNHSSTTTEEAATISSELQENVPHTAISFYKRYEGTIAGQPVVVYLEKDDTTYNGYYYYTKMGKPITLMGTRKNHDDTLLLQEYPPGSTTAEVEIPELHCYFSGENILGEWKSKKKNYPISLQEKYAEGAYGFQIKKYQDTAMLLNDAKSPFATASYKIPVAIGNNEDVKWLNEQIRKSLGSKNKNGTVEALIKEMNDSFFLQYRNDNLEEIQEAASKGEEYPYRMNYDETSNYTVRYNENGLVTIENTVYSYAGGAHGNYASLFHNYDVTAKKELKLQDLLTIDSISMQKILEQHFRKDYNIPSPKPLTEMLFDPYLATTDNFYLTEKGLGFLYNPYEVAAYAVGQIEVFVPYSSLTHYLTPTFKKRIKL